MSLWFELSVKMNTLEELCKFGLLKLTVISSIVLQYYVTENLT